MELTGVGYTRGSCLRTCCCESCQCSESICSKLFWRHWRIRCLRFTASSV